MLVASKVEQALATREGEFRRTAGESLAHRIAYGKAWDELALLSATEVRERLAGHEWPGARPAEDPSTRGAIVRFSERWDTARDAREWALERLQGVPTVAVDGSQIAASKEFAVPVSLVQ